MLKGMEKKLEKLKIRFHGVFNPLSALSIEMGRTEELFSLKSAC